MAQAQAVTGATDLTRHSSPLIAWRAGLFVFVASCATLVLELTASRLLSPFVGSSLYTWTTIIGVILAGISLGNWLGGKVADRFPGQRTVGLLFVLSGLSTLGVLAIVALLGDGSVVRPIQLLVRTFLLTTLIFFPPSFILSMITPVVIRLLLPDVRSTGRIVGVVYALGTLGSLAGNFLTGFVLVAYFTVSTIVASVGLVLLALGALGGDWWRKGDDSPSGGARSGPDGGARPSPAPSARSEGSSPSPLQLGEAGPASARPGGGSDSLAVAPEARGADGQTRGLGLRGNVGLACAVVVVSSFCSMVIETAASRALAPFVGVSLYSWTGIIGVVLAGIATGNYLGGRIADRWPRQPVLGLCLFLSGLASLSVLVTIQLATEGAPFGGLGLMERIVALTAAVFFAPVLLLGTISPQVIKLAVTDVGHAGRISGRIYAWSTGGAIVGTFLTGWLLISLVGVYLLVLAVGLALVVVAVAVGQFWRSAAALVAAAAVTAGAVYGLSARDALASPCTMETNYFCIKVGDSTFANTPVKTLVLDHLIHSYVKLDDPSFLGYPHEQVQAEFARYAAAKTATPHVLVIGGGGYTYPRWVEAFVPSATVEVVEIDPGVTETAYRYLGLSRDTRIVSHALDGRQFIHELAPKGYYHLVVQDAVNDLSVPYHIMTREYDDYVRESLTDDGIYLLTVIDLYQDGQLLRSAIRTMMQSFPEVRLLGASPQWTYPGASVFVIAGSKRPIDLADMRSALRQQGVEMRTVAQPDEELRAYVAQGPQIVLTDQYAPVDNLISILFRSRN